MLWNIALIATTLPALGSLFLLLRYVLFQFPLFSVYLFVFLSGVTAPSYYQTTYEARVTVLTCKYNSTASNISSITTLANPRKLSQYKIINHYIDFVCFFFFSDMPVITSIHPKRQDFPSSDFYIIIDGGLANCTTPQNLNENTTTCRVPAGVGASHTLQIILDPFVYFSCTPQVSNIVSWKYPLLF